MHGCKCKSALGASCGAPLPTIDQAWLCTPTEAIRNAPRVVNITTASHACDAQQAAARMAALYTLLAIITTTHACLDAPPRPRRHHHALVTRRWVARRFPRHDPSRYFSIHKGAGRHRLLAPREERLVPERGAEIYIKRLQGLRCKAPRVRAAAVVARVLLACTIMLSCLTIRKYGA